MIRRVEQVAVVPVNNHARGACVNQESTQRIDEDEYMRDHDCAEIDSDARPWQWTLLCARNHPSASESVIFVLAFDKARLGILNYLSDSR